ncbi:ABC transporter permease [bacterium]|nr:ABC transporter permease [bacterium]
MFKNYLKIALRNLWKQKTYSFINIAGLSVGLAAFILIFMYVKEEIRYDAFHENGSRIYRMYYERQDESNFVSAPALPTGVGATIKQDIPDIESVVRFYAAKPILTIGDQPFREESFYFADNGVFDMFSFPLLSGDPKTALSEPFSIVLTETMAKKYFGDSDPIGKIIRYENQYDMKVTGVMKDIPTTSHLQFDCLASFLSLQEILRYLLKERVLNDWVMWSFYTYVLLQDKMTPMELTTPLRSFLDKNIEAPENKKLTFGLQLLSDIHLRSHHTTGDIATNGDIKNIYIFAMVGIFVLLLSCINFTNLSIARSGARLKEVGLRKVVGAQRSQLIRQFLGESVLYCMLSFALAVLWVELSVPAFNELSGRHYTLGGSFTGLEWAGLVMILFIVAAISGSYPALFLSAFRPAAILKGSFKMKARTGLRRTLIVAQFAISIALMIATVVVHRQLQFMQNSKLDLADDQIVVLPLPDGIKKQFDAFKQELLKNRSVTGISAASSVPGRGQFRQSYHAEGANEGDNLFWSTVITDHEFLKTYGLELYAGRDFSKDIVTDAGEAFIINETAAAQLTWAEPLGKEITLLNETPPLTGRVIGVVKDFHFRSMKERIEPLVIRIQPFWHRVVSIRIHGTGISETLTAIESIWKQFSPGRPFEYSFIDQEYEKLYRTEERLSDLFLYFSALAIGIACLGLFGLAAYAAEQRTKEIGIRKILGASNPRLIALLSKEFTMLVLIANIVAWPAAYFFMQRWLEDFAYRTAITADVFILAAAAALIIAFLTVSGQALKAASSNPADVLKYE